MGSDKDLLVQVDQCHPDCPPGSKKVRWEKNGPNSYKFSVNFPGEYTQFWKGQSKASTEGPGSQTIKMREEIRRRGEAKPNRKRITKTESGDTKTEALLRALSSVSTAIIHKNEGLALNDRRIEDLTVFVYKGREIKVASFPSLRKVNYLQPISENTAVTVNAALTALFREAGYKIKAGAKLPDGSKVVYTRDDKAQADFVRLARETGVYREDHKNDFLFAIRAINRLSPGSQIEPDGMIGSQHFVGIQAAILARVVEILMFAVATVGVVGTFGEANGEELTKLRTDFASSKEAPRIIADANLGGLKQYDGSLASMLKIQKQVQSDLRRIETAIKNSKALGQHPNLKQISELARSAQTYLKKFELDVGSTFLMQTLHISFYLAFNSLHAEAVLRGGRWRVTITVN